MGLDFIDFLRSAYESRPDVGAAIRIKILTDKFKQDNKQVFDK